MDAGPVRIGVALFSEPGSCNCVWPWYVGKLIVNDFIAVSINN